jgi:methyltransferase (TIGR00027 family)
MQLNDVSKTAIVTLRSRVAESEKNKPLIHDPMARYCLDRLATFATEAEKTLLFNRRLSPALTSHIGLRARKYDAIVNEFISRNSESTMINLGCGFDTRYWRIDHEKCRYLELDLPEVVELKKEALNERLSYELMAGSVLDTAWIDTVASGGNRNCLLVAEGLFMYLPRAEVIGLFKAFSKKLYHSQIVLEVVTEQYTRGLWKKIVILKMKQDLGFDSGSSYNFGVKNALELEAFADGIRVVNEWSYVEDPDLHPRILKYLGLSRTQWTVTATINENR